jgi:hypothetical protein
MSLRLSFTLKSALLLDVCSDGDMHASKVISALPMISKCPRVMGSNDARHDQPPNAFTHSVQFLRRARRDVEELGLADEMHHGYRRIDAPSDAVKLELFR